MRRACTPTSSRSTTPSSFPYDASNVQLGKGGSGVVYLARHHESRQLVALKRCYPRLTEPLLSSASPLAPPTVSDDGFSCASPMMADETSRSLRDLNPAIMAEELDERRTSPMVKPTSAHHRHQSARNEEEMREESNLEVMAANTTNHNNTAAEDDQTACAERNASSSSGGHPSSPLVAADEALLLASLPPHPHIIRFLAKYHSQRRGSYVALELMQSDVGKEMTALRKTNYAQIACIVYSVLQALDHLHAHGIAHRDVKPGNILLKRILPADVGAGSELHALFPENDRTSILMNQAPLVPNMEVPPVELHETVYDDDEEGRCANVGASFSPTSSGKCRRYISATLADFSAAHYVGHVHDRSLASTRGTLYYKAPEQLLGKCIDHYTACDVWGMGCTMFEMVAGHVAFRGRSELQVQLEICRALGTTFADFPKRVNHATLLDELHPGGASEAFGDLLLRMLELDPEKRITARDALAHPFFDPITHARRTVCAGELCANPVQICFTMRLFSARSTEVGLVAMTEPFFPVAITPTKNRQRRLCATADGRRTNATAHNSNEESSPSANPHTSTSSGSPPGPISRRMSASRPPHHVSGGGHPDSGDDECSTGLRSARSGTSPSLTGLPAPCALTSFVSDGPSIHLSQMRCDTADTSLNCSVGITYSPSGRAPHAPLAPHSQPLAQHASSAMMMTHTLRDSSATPSSRLPSAEMLTTGGGYSAARRLSGFSPRTMNSASRILNTSSATTCSSSDGVHAGGSSTHSLCPRPRLTACPLHPPQDAGMEMDGVLHQTATNTHIGTRPRLFMASGSSTTVVRPAYEGGAPACDGPSAAHHHHRRSWSGDSSENGMPPPGVAVGRQLGFSEEPSYREGPQGEMMMMMDDDADSIDASALVTPQRRAGMFAAKALSFETPSAERASVAADDSPYNPPHVCSSGRSIPRPTTIMSEMMSGNQRLGHHNTSAMASVEAGGDRCAPPPPPLPVPLTLAAAATRSTPGALVISPRLTISARTPATTIAGVARPYTRSGAEEVHGRRLGGGQGGAGRIIFMERSPNVRPTAENGEQLASPSPKQPYTFAVGACGQRAPHISAPREATEPSPPTTATPRPPMHPNNNAEHAAHHRGGSGMKRARVGDSQHR